jgi:glycosyltransferase involved in cell wall biosynthesis
MEKISFVIPCYRSEKTIEKVVDEIISTMNLEKNYDYEIILVNDYSPDGVWDVINKLCSNIKIKGICLAKNFGQASAVMAGYSQVTGDYIITMDDDGQSPVDATFEILNKLKNENFDVVFGISTEVQFNTFRRFGSKVNGMMAKAMFDRPADKRIVNFSISRRFVIEEMKKYHNPYTYISGLVYRSTANIGYLPVIHRARISGKSGYSFKKLLSVWLNGFTAFSVKPLRIASYFGVITAVLGILFGFITVINKLLNPAVAVGWSSIVSIMLILGGIILLVLGMIGEYLGRIYICINNAPQYVIKEVVNGEIGGKHEI